MNAGLDLSNVAVQHVLNNTFRKLWEEHAIWTRLFIISNVENLKDLQPTTQRLLQNPKDIANVLTKFYGAEKAKEFERLLTEHLLIAGNLVNYAKAGDKAKADEVRINWYKNADDIAKFLSVINPFWSQKVWQSMLYDHLKMTENEATYRIKGQYADDIAEFDEIENQALLMADYMTRGIAQQYNVR